MNDNTIGRLPLKLKDWSFNIMEGRKMEMVLTAPILGDAYETEDRFVEFDLAFKFDPIVDCKFSFEDALKLDYNIENFMMYSESQIKDVYKKECEKLWPLSIMYNDNNDQGEENKILELKKLINHIYCHYTINILFSDANYLDNETNGILTFELFSDGNIFKMKEDLFYDKTKTYIFTEEKKDEILSCLSNKNLYLNELLNRKIIGFGLDFNFQIKDIKFADCHEWD
jgi:hypothetical protein